MFKSVAAASTHFTANPTNPLSGFFVPDSSNDEIETPFGSSQTATQEHMHKLLKATFDKLDTDSNGFLDRDELRQCFVEAGKVVNMEMIDRIVEGAIDALMEDLSLIHI